MVRLLTIFNVIYNEDNIPKIEASLVIKNYLLFFIVKNYIVIINVAKSCPVKLAKKNTIRQFKKKYALCDLLFYNDSTVTVAVSDKLHNINKLIDELIIKSNNNDVESKKY